jgi:hypothetical protein
VFTYLGKLRKDREVLESLQARHVELDELEVCELFEESLVLSTDLLDVLLVQDELSDLFEQRKLVTR